MGEKKEPTDLQISVRVSRVGIYCNVALTAFKLFAGIFAHSSAMVADAVHSLSDVAGGFIVIFGARKANKKADEEHPYGHERMECVVSLLLAFILAITGIAIGYTGIQKVISANYAGLAAPGILALVAAVVSIVLKEALYWYTRAAGKKINSVALIAQAWHHRSDAFSSVGSFLGILGARLAFPVLDPIASMVICLFILKVAYDIFKESVDRMIDRSCGIEEEQKLREVIMEQKGVVTIDDLKTRLFGAKIYVDLEIGVDRNLRVFEGHSIAESVHKAIEKAFPTVKHITVHVNPEKVSAPL
ncbi:MAG: cation diffusion facilitator family transporter [Oscillibacter sp.]|nr:cation diffusion facilitator family transporter [Oscillibacter sp.]